MTTVLAIDQGTSGTKAMVVDGSDRVLGVVELPVRPRYLSGGGVEQDPESCSTRCWSPGGAPSPRRASRSTA